ncbi:MAG TPA: HEPN domain-containing protein [Deltaproteobacteria bacterium]|nr:HEPN domain-containing protein [Deltaproteobacteria bacterium]
MHKAPEEWFRQAEYDMGTADAKFESKRYIYTVFMCHLAVEKALKGLYQQRLNEAPPKIHNLIYLVEKLDLRPPDDLYEIIFSLNRVSIPTRYPDNIERMKKEYSKRNTTALVKKGREVLKWLKAQL